MTDTADILKVHAMGAIWMIAVSAQERRGTMNKARKIVEIVYRLLAEKDILDPTMTIDEVVEKRFEYSNPDERIQLVKLVHEFRKNGKVDWNRKIIKSN